MDRREFLKLAAVTSAGIALPRGFQAIAEAAEASARPDLVVVRGASPEQAVKAAIDAMGGIKKFVTRGDVVVIEPKETDVHIFRLNALAYWQRIRAAHLGYISVNESIQQNYDLIKQILESYGVLMTRRQVRAGVERIREESTEEASSVLTDEVPSRNLSVA